MTKEKSTYKMRLDALVLKVCHLDLSECRDFAEFKVGIAAMVNNLEETLAVLVCCKFPNPRIRRAADGVKLKAVHLLDLCRRFPESFEGSKKWHELASVIIANYEQFRIDAGHLYRLAVPSSTFDVLRSAL